MKDKITNLVGEKIEKLNVFVDDVFISTEEGKKILNIVLDSEEVIDLNLITEASRIINKLIDQNQMLDDDIYEVDIYEVDIYSKEKGE